MFEVQCFDIYGNTINNFTQWDVDQKIIIPIDSFNLPNGDLPSYSPYSPPEVHFCNYKSKEAYVVRSTVVDGETIAVFVPNILLQESYPVLVYVYLTDSEDSSSQKTILHNEIPVRKRAKPSDYFYVENIRRITAEMMKDEIEMAVNETRQAAIDNINQTKDTAIAEVDNQMNASYNEGSVVVGGNTYTGGFVNIGNDILSELDKIKEDSLTEYNDTVEIAETTQAQIEESIDTTMNENGLSVQPVDDGEGNVDIVILLNQSSAS